VSAPPSIRRADRLGERDLADLSEVLIAVVAAGASVGWLPPVDPVAADAYWRRTAEAARDDVILLLAETDGRIVGTAQVLPAESANGRHRGEVAKVLVHPDWQRRGIGRVLMARLEAEARAAGKTLLVLDTRVGDPANALYRVAGWTAAGQIPNWARGADGALYATQFWYKQIAATDGGRSPEFPRSSNRRLLSS
jgi:GNAT superfamily N-acetyltransferase